MANDTGSENISGTLTEVAVMEKPTIIPADLAEAQNRMLRQATEGHLEATSNADRKGWVRRMLHFPQSWPGLHRAGVESDAHIMLQDIQAIANLALNVDNEGGQATILDSEGNGHRLTIKDGQIINLETVTRTPGGEERRVPVPPRELGILPTIKRRHTLLLRRQELASEIAAQRRATSPSTSAQKA